MRPGPRQGGLDQIASQDAGGGEDLAGLAATLCSASTSYLPGTMRLTEVKSRCPRVKA
jgi:hypothetical protein